MRRKKSSDKNNKKRGWRMTWNTYNNKNKKGQLIWISLDLFIQRVHLNSPIFLQLMVPSGL